MSTPGRKQTARERAALSPIKNIQWAEWAPAVPIQPGQVILYRRRKYIVQKPRNAIRKASLARRRQLTCYSKRIKVWKVENPVCEAMIEGLCTTHTQDCHHTNKRNGSRLLDEKFWLPVCRPCHHFITNNPGWARDNGLIK
jgi:hypothetical protein